MKYKTTKKAVLNGYTYTIAAPYCTLQDILQYKEPIAYIANQYGWRADIYAIGDDTAIITGYEPCGTIRPDHLQLQDWNDKARAILQQSPDVSTAKQALNALIADFLNWAKETAV